MIEGGMSRDSTGQLTSRESQCPNNGRKILSRYLKPSISSCHDICKYGKDSSETKGKHPFIRSLPHNIQKKPVIPSKDLKFESGTRPSAQKRTASSVKRTASSSHERTDSHAKPAISLRRKTSVVKPVLLPNPMPDRTSGRNQETEMIDTHCIKLKSEGIDLDLTQHLKEEINKSETESSNGIVGITATPHKLKFRRGKVVDLDPQSDGGPRKLKFRRGIVVGEEDPHGNGEAMRAIFERGELCDSVSNDQCSEAQTVMLRHRDKQERRDSQCLLNLVIEEAATKLTEARKSKVKALVGAFETVISLQESKPASLMA